MQWYKGSLTGHTENDIDIHDICAQLGVELVDVIAHRRGSVLLKAVKDGRTVAIKGYDPSETDTYDRKELLDREAVTLEAVNPFLGVNLFVDYVSVDASSSWLITEWIDGVTASEFARDLKGDRVQQLAAMFRGAALGLHKVNEAGYLHGDIQPAHVIISSDATDPILIDWGLGRRIADEVPYSGGFVHYAAPEIAQGMIEGRSDITYTISSEVYSFGAMMAFCYSGKTAVGYDLSEPLPEKLAKVAHGELREFVDATSPEEQSLVATIKRCLSFDPKERPASLNEVGVLLGLKV